MGPPVCYDCISNHSKIKGDTHMNYISNKMLSLLERLAEMFPKQHYQSELERYVNSRFPQNAADVEHFTKEFEYRKQGNLI